MKHLDSGVLINPNITITIKKDSILCHNNRGDTIFFSENDDNFKYKLIRNITDNNHSSTFTVKQCLDNLLKNNGTESSPIIKDLFELVHSEVIILIPKKIEISKGEERRYHRQLAFFNKYQSDVVDIYDIQNNLKNCKLAVVGLGGQGSIVATYLASVGVGNLILIDGDRIEESNLARQIFYTHDDIGKFKAQVLRSYVIRQNPYINVKSFNKKIRTKNDILKYVGVVDFIVLCGDEPMIYLREWVNEFCIDNNIPHMGVSGNWVGPICIPGKTACFECEKNFYRKKYKHYENIINWWITHSIESNHRPAFVFNPSASGLFIAQQIVKFLTRVMPVEILDGHWSIDSSLSTYFEIIPRDKKCKCCKKVYEKG